MIDFTYVDLTTNGTAAVALIVPGAAPAVRRRPGWSLDRRRALSARLRPAGDLMREESRRFVAPVAALSAISAAATAASPLLLSWPLLLVALTPRLPFLVLAAAEVPLLPFLAVATLRLALVDPWYFALGRRRGPAVIDLLGRRARWAVRLASRAAWLLVLARPVGRHLVLAGAGPARGWVIAVADAAGTLAFLVTVHTGTTTVIG
ncbi:MAG: hypothetical protein WKF93_02905 [Acidimicrobiales bacterium]